MCTVQRHDRVYIQLMSLPLVTFSARREPRCTIQNFERKALQPAESADLGASLLGSSQNSLLAPAYRGGKKRFRCDKMSYDEIDIEDMEWKEDIQAFTYQCPCGDLFQITMVRREAMNLVVDFSGIVTLAAPHR